MSLWTTYGLPDPTPEYKFHPVRKWRFDFAWIPQKVAVEIEGGVWTHGAHVRGKHFMSDMEKYNEAAKMGWRVFRFTPQQYKVGQVYLLLKDVLDNAEPKFREVTS